MRKRKREVPTLNCCCCSLLILPLACQESWLWARLRRLTLRIITGNYRDHALHLVIEPLLPHHWWVITTGWLDSQMNRRCLALCWWSCLSLIRVKAQRLHAALSWFNSVLCINAISLKDPHGLLCQHLLVLHHFVWVELFPLHLHMITILTNPRATIVHNCLAIRLLWNILWEPADATCGPLRIQNVLQYWNLVRRLRLRL